MVLNIGDQARQQNFVGHEGENVDDDVREGDFVTLNDDMTISRLREGDTIHGVVNRIDFDMDNRATVQLSGLVVAHVPESVVAGEHLGSPDVTEGGEASGSAGHLDNQRVEAQEDATQDYGSFEDSNDEVMSIMERSMLSPNFSAEEDNRFAAKVHLK